MQVAKLKATNPNVSGVVSFLVYYRYLAIRVKRMGTCMVFALRLLAATVTHIVDNPQ